MASNDELQVNFRMPAELKVQLQKAADASGRTLTAEVVHRLSESFVVQAEVRKLANDLTNLKSRVHILNTAEITLPEDLSDVAAEAIATNGILAHLVEQDVINDKEITGWLRAAFANPMAFERTEALQGALDLLNSRRDVERGFASAVGVLDALRYRTAGPKKKP